MNKCIVLIGVLWIGVTSVYANEVQGVVRDANGVALEGVAIKIMPMGGRDEIVTNEQGQFTASWNPRVWGDEDTAFYIMARDRARNLAAAVPLNPEAESQDLVLKPAVAMTGRVVDSNGQGIADARIRVMFRASNWGSTMDRPEQFPVTNDRGEYVIPVLPAASRFALTAMAQGYGECDLDVETNEPNEGQVSVEDMVLPIADQMISGQVVDLNGEPVPGLQLRCYGDGQPDSQAATDVEGDFVFEGLCQGIVTINGSTRSSTNMVSCRATVQAGMTDIKLVASPGQRAANRFIRIKSREEIIATGQFVAGRVVDEAGHAVANVPVNVQAIRREREPGRYSWTYSSYNTLGDVTDKQGQFIIEVEEDAAYCLCFSPFEQAAMMVYDLPMGTKDHIVTLPVGGTVTGRLTRWVNGKEVLMANESVSIAQTDRSAYSHLGFDQDRTTVTDEQGRFEFKHLRQVYRSDRNTGEYSARSWEVSYKDLSQTVNFYDTNEVQVDFVIKPKLADAEPLKGKALPNWDTLGVSLDSNLVQGKKLLVFFFNFEQRLDRRRLLQIANQQAALSAKNISVVAIDMSDTDTQTLQAWTKEQSLPCVIQANGAKDELQFDWNVQALPWLILTDEAHVVTCEGLSVEEVMGQ